MVGNNENILVEFDYNNITIVDPNKVIDASGNVKERLVNHEDLVFYANLECKVIPRTKLAVGVASNDAIQTVSVATINFLKQGDKEFLDNTYTDEITGKESLLGKGQNQPKQTLVTNPSDSADKFIRQTINTGGKPGAQDNGLLGITGINIRQGLDFLPVISVTLEDVKGRALFEAGDNSPYAAFFNLPYPLFNLTLKGYFGKAIKLSLMLQSFNARYDTYSGNFKIDLKFYTYKYTVLNEVTMGYILAVPHMYKSRIKITPVQTTQTANKTVIDTTTSIGFMKIKEMYSEYKAKGLITDDFPEITIVQMRERLQNFVKNELDKFTKQNMQPLTNVQNFENELRNFEGSVLLYSSGEVSWFNKYMDKTSAIVLNNGITVYTFKKDYSDIKKKKDAISELSALIQKYKKILEGNETLGVKGQYTINGKKPVKCSVPFEITLATFSPFGTTATSSGVSQPFTEQDINFIKTYNIVKNTKDKPSDIQLSEFKTQVLGGLNFNSKVTLEGEIIQPDYFYFESPTELSTQALVNQLPIIGTNSFTSKISKMRKETKTYKEQIEAALTEALAELLQDKSSGIGFIPNIRNVLAVIFASAEAFLRLMDDTHTEAWNVRDSDIRRKAVLATQTQSASQEALTPGIDNQPIYPWPQVIKETTGTDGHEIYEIVYPGDLSIIDQTKAYLPDVWPEVEFVEEFINGFTDRATSIAPDPISQNEQTEVQRVSLNAIEFPISNEVYANKEEIKYFYEIYERALFVTYYSRLNRGSGAAPNVDLIYNIIAEAERINVLKSLSNDNPFLIAKLREYNYNGSNFEIFLRHISNSGTGELWQNFIRGVFNTKYINNKINNSNFQFITQDVLGNSIAQPLVSLPTETEFSDYINNSTSTNAIDFVDTYPFTDQNWVKTGLADGSANIQPEIALDTRKILAYNPANKIITNVTAFDSGSKPFTNFLPETEDKRPNGDTSSTAAQLKAFYNNRAVNFKDQSFTEGNLRYLNYSGDVTAEQTVSILNTPYFVNAIQQGVKNFRNYETNPYKEAAYLFINSLPLSTLREQYKIKEGQSELSYIFATLKKFGGVHKLPYAWILKYGSIWNRYKTFIETGTDYIDTSWSGFNYTYNFNPVVNNTNASYTFSAGTDIGIVEIVLEKNITLGPNTSTTINTGFYPKTINDFNVFYQGYELFSDYTSIEIQNAIASSGFTIDYAPSANISLSDGFDPNDPNRDLRIFSWTSYVAGNDGISSFILPSQGSLLNQTKYECFKPSGTTLSLTKEVLNNQSVFDGSVRSFWTSPNYGYFDSSKVAKPTPLQYIKQIFSGLTNQENFSINSGTTSYTPISEMFSVFEKDVLDLFEAEFLNFSVDKYKFTPTNTVTGAQTSVKDMMNFQLLMTDLMKIPKLTGGTGEDRIITAQKTQFEKMSKTLNKFIMDINLIVKFGNPSQFDKKLFYSFSNLDIVDPYTWEKYSTNTPNALPGSGGQTLANSISLYPNEWKALQTYVGFSEIPELVYDNNGSYITDFFINLNVAFNTQNVINFAPVIKMFATQKLANSGLTATSFFTGMDDYLNSLVEFKTNVLNDLMPKVQKELPVTTIQGNNKINSKLEGDQTKVELWESFKALNDKWISGADFKTKTLFEDVLLLDRASRNIGDKILVDIFKLVSRLNAITEGTNIKSSVKVFVETILIENNFVVMNLPSYVNFYNVQDVVKNPTPKPEGTLDFANNLFGTFLNVDYRQASAKMVCFYGGKPSEQLDMKNNVDFRYRNDSFDLTRSSSNPLVDDLTNKQDWAQSNKVVGFNVDIGPQNQSIFHGFSVGQDAGKATAESIEVLNEMANQSRNRSGASQSTSLYNLYKNRSYNCSVTMMGNALIQPTMYFNLRYVPMFNGPYMITSVNHNISPGKFETTFEGIRQPTASLPKIDNYLQSLKTNLLESIKNQLSSSQQPNQKPSTNTNANSNVQSQTAEASNQANTQDSTTVNSGSSATCEPLSDYITYTKLDNPSTFTLNTQQIVNKVVALAPSNDLLQCVLFTTIYMASKKPNDTNTYVGVENNYMGISISKSKQTASWGQVLLDYGKKSYYCSSTNVAYATFESIDNNIIVLRDRWKNRLSGYSKTKESIAKFWVLNNDTSKTREDSVYTGLTQVQKTEIEDKIQKAIDLFTQTPK
jgi:hypothetical protein